MLDTLHARFGIPWYGRLWGFVVALVGAVGLVWIVGLAAPYELLGRCVVPGDGRVECDLRARAMVRETQLTVRATGVARADVVRRAVGKSVDHVVVLRDAQGALRGELRAPQSMAALPHTEAEARALAAQLDACLRGASHDRPAACAALPVAQRAARPWFPLVFGAWMVALGLAFALYDRRITLDPRTGAVHIVAWGPIPLHRRRFAYTLPPDATLRARYATRKTSAGLVYVDTAGKEHLLLETFGQHDNALERFAHEATAALAAARAQPPPGEALEDARALRRAAHTNRAPARATET